MTLQHAIYGSAGGLSDYRILGASGDLDDVALTKIAYYASLGGSAIANKFDPIFSFYPLDGQQWAFARTLFVAPTSRGSDYLVHAIVVDEQTLDYFDFKPFVLLDAGLFVSEKPARDSVLPRLELNVAPRPPNQAPDLSAVAFALRALSRGSLRLLLPDHTDAVATCRAIHESLTPDDRRNTSFCTRFSYRRALDFRLAAFIRLDEDIVQEQKNAFTTVTFFSPEAKGVRDVYDQWTSDAYGRPELELRGMSILDRPEDAMALVVNVRRLRQWTRGASETFDLSELQPASELVLLPENRDRPSISPLVPGALAVNLSGQVEQTLSSSQPFDGCAATAYEFLPAIRRDAARWISHLEVAPLKSWMAEIFLLLPDEKLDPLVQRLLQQDQSALHLVRLSDRDRVAYRAFLGTVLDIIRHRFGGAGAAAVALIAQSLSADTVALTQFTAAMEQAVRDAERAVQAVWLMAIVRNVVEKLVLSPKIAVRILLSYGLLSELTSAELARYAPLLFDFRDKLSLVLAATQPARVYDALIAAAHQRLRERDWAADDDTAADILRRVMLGTSEVLSRAPETGSEWDLTAVVFLSAIRIPLEKREGIADAVEVAVTVLKNHGLISDQAVLLRGALQAMMRAPAGAISISSAAAVALYDALRTRSPRDWLVRLGWYLGMTTSKHASRTTLARKAA